MRLTISVLFVLLTTSTISKADIVLKCQWIIKTNMIKERSKESGKEIRKWKKELFNVSPSGCVEFEYNNFGIPELTKEKWAELSEAYERPWKIHLKCPEGYSPGGEISWGLTTGVTRQHFLKAYYLDNYVAEQSCIRETLARI